MPCRDDLGTNKDGEPLPCDIVAERTADLCRIAEETCDNIGRPVPFYVIGTEVPLPGGALGKKETIKPTSIESVEETLVKTQAAFYTFGLEAAWDRVVAVVVQPCVEFGDTYIIDYEKEKARELSLFIDKQENLVYEAHSTDFQKREALRKMVEDHFAILKVGPWLTFAFREAVFALEHIEEELHLSGLDLKLSRVSDIMEELMLEHPRYWNKHYTGNNTQCSFLRKYSYSDRCRYYWAYSKLNEALLRLIKNLTEHLSPLSLLSQYLPLQYQAVRSGQLSREPIELIRHKIMEVTAHYDYACSGS